jgi:hypothetical protein
MFKHSASSSRSGSWNLFWKVEKYKKDCRFTGFSAKIQSDLKSTVLSIEGKGERFLEDCARYGE